MPFYEYECPSCRYYLEVLQKITDRPLKKCPSCGKAGFRRLMSAPVFRLKGSGWYETDFKSDKDSKRNLAGPEHEEASEKPKTESGDAKAAAPEPAKSGDANATAKPEPSAPASDKGAARPARSSAVTRAGQSASKSTNKGARVSRPAPKAARRSARAATRRKGKR